MRINFSLKQWFSIVCILVLLPLSHFALSNINSTEDTIGDIDVCLPYFGPGGCVWTPELPPPGECGIIYESTHLVIDIFGNYTFSLADESYPGLSIDPFTGLVTLCADEQLYEQYSEISFSVLVTDSAGNISSQTVILSIPNYDTAPPMVNLSCNDIEENSGAGQVVCQAIADDSAYISDGVTFSLTNDSDPTLTIDAVTGEVILTVDPDYEVQNEYSLAVIATDAAGNSASAIGGFNILSAPQICPLIIYPVPYIDENSGANQVVYTAIAPDHPYPFDEFNFSLSEASDPNLFIDEITGELTLIPNPDYEVQSEYYFEVEIYDVAGNRVEGNYCYPNISHIYINNLDEVAPQITSVDSITVMHGTLGELYQAIADDSADISYGVSFSLAEDSDSEFSIDAQTGVVSIASDASFPFYSFTVVATDASDNATSLTVSVSVTQPKQLISVNNFPMGVLGRTSVLEVAYDTTDNNNQLSGLGMRVHFDSSLLSFKEVTDLIDQDIIVNGEGPFNDNANYDNDPLTDQYMLFGWASLYNNWPNRELPTVLMNIAFDVSDSIDIDVTPSTNINFTDSSFTVGYEFSANSYVLEFQRATWDFDGDGNADALTDGLMMLRYLFGLRGDFLTNGAMAGDSTFDSETTAANVEAAMDIADIDRDGELNALTDGLLLLRYLFGIRNASLTIGAVGSKSTRSTYDIQTYIELHMPPLPPIAIDLN